MKGADDDNTLTKAQAALKETITADENATEVLRANGQLATLKKLGRFLSRVGGVGIAAVIARYCYWSGPVSNSHLEPDNEQELSRDLIPPGHPNPTDEPS